MPVRHRHTTQLRWSDPGLFGHLNHARTLSLLRLDATCAAFGHDADRSRPFDDDERAYWTTHLEDAT